MVEMVEAAVTDKFLNENIIAKIANNLKQSIQNKQPVINQKQANNLNAFLTDPKMQQRMQFIAIQNLVTSFIGSLKQIQDESEKRKAIQQFYNTWSQQTDPRLLKLVMQKHKLM